MLRLLAAGRSNREIAAALFIAPKTASVHVSNIMAKLGAASRTEAAAIALQAGLARRDGPVRPAACTANYMNDSAMQSGLHECFSHVVGHAHGWPPGASSVRISSARATAPTGSAVGEPISGSQFRS